MISLPERLLCKLRREAADAAGFRLLCAEAVARRWLGSRRVPTWRCPDPPGREDRYSLLLPGWSRALVGPADAPPPSFDRMAAARCQLAVAVALEGDDSGEVVGWTALEDLQRLPPQETPSAPPPLRPPGELPQRIGQPRFPTVVLALGLLRLLAAGEPDPPPPEEGDGGILVGK